MCNTLLDNRTISAYLGNMNFTILLGYLSLLTPAEHQVPSAKLEIQVTGPRVVFFEPSSAEQDSIVRVIGAETGEVFDDFDYNAGKASVFLNARKIPVQFTSSPTIILKVGKTVVRQFDRQNMPEMVGVILINRNIEPRLIQGVATEEELIGEFVDFFQLK